MSAEAIDPVTTGEVVELFGTDALIRRRVALHHRLGEASMLLNEASHAYHGCIEEIIEVNTQLREAGVDTDALARELQQVTAPEAAINGYGKDS